MKEKEGGDAMIKREEKSLRNKTKCKSWTETRKNINRKNRTIEEAEQGNEQRNQR